MQDREQGCRSPSSWLVAMRPLVVVPAMLWALLLALLLAGCATPARHHEAPVLAYDPALLSGERLFGAPLVDELVPDVAVSEADEQMRDYVADLVEDAQLSATRFRRLLGGLIRDGYFGAGYSPYETLTAAEAFRARSGNCLSYTNLFVALAREAGLDAVYQVVDVPPSWDADAGFLIRYTHINVLLPGLKVERLPGEAVTVDFNIVHPDPEHARQTVSDAYAKSLYYANHSIELLRGNRPREAFAYLRRAIELESANADLWVNMGALYSIRGDFSSSIEAFQVAVQLEPANRAALAGLARSHRNLGDDEMALYYDARVRNYLETNPYYHLAMAQAAIGRADYDLALDSINRAIGLQRRSGRLHFVKGLIEEQRGDLTAARDSFRNAKRFGLRNERKLAHIDRTVGMASF